MVLECARHVLHVILMFVPWCQCYISYCTPPAAPLVACSLNVCVCVCVCVCTLIDYANPLASVPPCVCVCVCVCVTACYVYAFVHIYLCFMSLVCVYVCTSIHKLLYISHI